jgi:hypothetical protein
MQISSDDNVNEGNVGQLWPALGVLIFFRKYTQYSGVDNQCGDVSKW